MTEGTMGALGGLLGAITGILSLVLSVWTIRQSNDRDRVKLRVKAGPGMTMPQGKSVLAISVTNLSTFPITLYMATVEVVSAASGKPGAAFSFDYTTTAGVRLPYRMEPRSAITIYYPWQFCRSMINDGQAPRCVRVDTECGEIVRAQHDEIVEIVTSVAKAGLEDGSG